MLGFGGTFVEDLQGVALRLSPLTQRDAQALLDVSGITAAIMRLGGEHSGAALAKLKNLTLAFDVLCCGCGAALAEFDVNPLGFSSISNDFCALDAKIVLANQE